MVWYYGDDEPINAPEDDSPVSGPEAVAFRAGKTELRIINKVEAPLEDTDFKVMLELTGADSGKDRYGVDLVLVLDISLSMSGKKLWKMKNAVKFLIRKLSPIDRLSIVKFSTYSERLCPLTCVTQTVQPMLEELVDNICPENSTDITAGLIDGWRVLNDRHFTENRVAAIMLMSDGKENEGRDASQFLFKNFPVHTFGLGKKHDPEVLQAIADNSKGGTFSDVHNTENLSIAFAQCLAGLLTVVVQDLELTVKPHEMNSEIQGVSAGSYEQLRIPNDGATTIMFGDLYAKEIRRVMVDLTLPLVYKPVSVDFVEVNYKYSSLGTMGKPFEAPPVYAGVKRKMKTMEPEREEVATEDSRIETAKMMVDARKLADANYLGYAAGMIFNAKTMLETNAPNNSVIDMLKLELDTLEKLMSSPELYWKEGRPFALSSETSHDRQRFAARGDNMDSLRLFATPRMDKYLEQAKSFDKDPTKPLPTAEDDVKQELLANPLGPFVGALSYYILMAVQALRSIEVILKKSG